MSDPTPPPFQPTPPPYQSTPPPPPQFQPPPPTGLSDNAAGAVAYITFVPAIVFLVMPPYNASSYVRFHAWQSIFLNIAAFVISIALSMFLAFSIFFGGFFFLAITRMIWLAWLIVWLICVLKALNGQRFKLPIIGPLAEKQAGA